MSFFSVNSCDEVSEGILSVLLIFFLFIVGPDYVNITGNEKTFASEGASLTLTCSTATLGTVAENPTYTIIRWRNDTNDQVQFL